MEIKNLEVNAKVPKVEITKGKKRVYLTDDKGNKIYEDKNVRLSINVDEVKKRGFDTFVKEHKLINSFTKDGTIITDKKALWREITGETVPQKKDK